MHGWMDAVDVAIFILIILILGKSLNVERSGYRNAAAWLRVSDINLQQ